MALIVLLFILLVGPLALLAGRDSRIDDRFKGWCTQPRYSWSEKSSFCRSPT